VELMDLQVLQDLVVNQDLQEQVEQMDLQVLQDLVVNQDLRVQVEQTVLREQVDLPEHRELLEYLLDKHIISTKAKIRIFLVIKYFLLHLQDLHNKRLQQV
jgi:hypothetical protein